MLKLVERCCLFFCLPLTEAEFVINEQNAEKDFIFKFTHDPEIPRSWFDYQEQVADPFIEFYEYFSSTGLMIISNGTYSEFIKLINSKVADVIILLTHCKDGGDPAEEAIEFYDRMVLSAEILSADLYNYPLVLDISVCQPKYLSRELPHFHSGFACFTSEEPKDLTVWLYIYSLIFKEMHDNQVSFLKAYQKIFIRINT